MKTRVVAGGRSVVDTCPACTQKARFDEVEVTESFGAFFLDLIDDKEHKHRCSACGERFDRRDEPATEPAPPARPARDLAAERRAHAETRANRIEDELAELKQRLGY